MGIRKLMKNRVAQNASWFIAGKIGQAVLALFINILTVRYLGPTNYGIISYAASVVAFVLPVMYLGLNDILVQELTNHPEEEEKILGTSMVLSVASSFACIVSVIMYTFLVDAGETVTNVVVCLYSLTLVLQAVELIQYWFQYKLLSKYQAIITFTAYAIITVYKVILLVSKANIYWFAIAQSIDYVLVASAMVISYRKLGGKRLAFSAQIGKRMFASSRHYILSNLMVTVFAQTDRIMLKLMIDEASVGYYQAAVTCASMTSFVFIAIIDSFRPIIFQHKKAGDLHGYEENMARLYCIIIYLALLQSAFMTVLAPLIIKILYGAEYMQSVGALQIIVWYTTFSYMGSVRNIWILSEGKQKYLWAVNLGGVLMNIAINFLLIPVCGIYGAAIASLITQVFTNVAMNRIIKPLQYNNVLMARGLNPKYILELIKR